MKDPLLKLIQLSEYIWNEKKALHHGGHPKQTINRIKKAIEELKELQPKLEQEIEVLSGFYKIKK